MEQVSPEKINQSKTVVTTEEHKWNHCVSEEGLEEIKEILEVSHMCSGQGVLWTLKVDNITFVIKFINLVFYDTCKSIVLWDVYLGHLLLIILIKYYNLYYKTKT